ncbi:hypothetical protein EYF80_066559 [Liparis tanakae]|uniref:Uncharacterized protein n=1 Tax=Liparis tanakae TaxID=230148 RepID=A0A4Z2E4R5_9TELE|nr:hypothetical protein EYF80_066559 [Liparis tanakae]
MRGGPGGGGGPGGASGGPLDLVLLVLAWAASLGFSIPQEDDVRMWCSCPGLPSTVAVCGPSGPRPHSTSRFINRAPPKPHLNPTQTPPEPHLNPTQTPPKPHLNPT